jgi:hypothetical protein
LTGTAIADAHRSHLHLGRCEPIAIALKPPSEFQTIEVPKLRPHQNEQTSFWIAIFEQWQDLTVADARVVRRL